MAILTYILKISVHVYQNLKITLINKSHKTHESFEKSLLSVHVTFVDAFAF